MNLTRGLDRVLSKRENPAWPAIYPDLYGMSGGIEPEGQDFDNFIETMGSFTTIAAAVNKLISLAQSVPLYQADRETGERLESPRLTNRHGEDLLQRPNPGEGGTFFRQKSYLQLALTGNLFHSVFPTMQSPEEIWVNESRYMKPRLSQDNQYPFAGFNYVGSRKTVPIPADQVIFTRRPSARDRIYGSSFIDECADALELLWYSRKLNIALLKRGGRTGGFLHVKGGLGKPERDRLKQEIAARFGVNGSGKVVVLGADDATFTPDTTPPRDLEHQTTITETKLEIYNVFGFMPALFATRDVNRSNLREAKASAYEDVVRPFVSLMLEQWNASVMTQAARVRIRADWSAVEALQPNKLEMAQAADVLLKHQVAVPNEIAEWFGLEQKAWGDEPSRPPQLWPTGFAPPTIGPTSEPTAAPAAEPPARAARPGGGGGDEAERALRAADAALGIPPGGLDSRGRAFEERVALALREMDDATCCACATVRSGEPEPDMARARLRAAAGDRMDRVENRWFRKAERLFEAQRREVIANLRDRMKLLAPRSARASDDDRMIPPSWVGLEWFDLTEAERAWRIELLGIAGETLREGMENTGEALKASGVEAFKLDLEAPAIREFLDATIASKVAKITATGRDRLRLIVALAVDENVTVGELEQRIQEEFQYAKRVRARLQARTETAMLFTQGGMEAMKQNGVAYHSWLSARDSKTRSAHRAVDGQTVRVGEQFTMTDPDTGETSYGPGPGQMDRAWASIQCRCTTTPELGFTEAEGGGA